MTCLLPQSAIAITSLVSSISQTDTGNPIYISSLSNMLYSCGSAMYSYQQSTPHELPADIQPVNMHTLSSTKSCDKVLAYVQNDISVVDE